MRSAAVISVSSRVGGSYISFKPFQHHSINYALHLLHHHISTLFELIMKFGNTNPAISTVGSNGKGFRAVRNRTQGVRGLSSSNFVASTSSNTKTAAKPSTPAIGLSVMDINWRLVRTDDRIFLLLATVALGEELEVAKLERKDILRNALSVFQVESIKYILNELSECYPDVPVGETDPTDKDELVSVVVNFLMFAAIAKNERSTAAIYSTKSEQYW